VVDWHRFIPSDFEYDFERDERVELEESAFTAAKKTLAS